MFGEVIDYWLLRGLAHSRNRATEEELDSRAREFRPFESAFARQRLEKLLTRFEGTLKIDPNLSYLDVGCGRGDLVLSLIQAGARDVTGVDVLGRKIEEAKMAAKQATLPHQPHLMTADINTWTPGRQYDVILSHEALEHIDPPYLFIQALRRLLSPKGSAYLAFGPLFHSPVGDHLHEFFNVELPWRGVLFSEKALMAIRRECFRPGDPVTRFRDMRGGLNQMRYSEFLKYVPEAGFQFDFLSINPQLKRIPPLHWVSNMMSRTFVVQDYVVTSVYAKLTPDPALRDS